MTQNIDIDDPVRIETDSLTVEKRFDPQGEELTHVEFRLCSDGETPVDCRIVEDIPDEFPENRVGFHPDYGRENWSVEGRSLVYENTVEPGEELLTLYGVNAPVTDIGPLHREPDVEVDPVGEPATAGGEDPTGDPFRDLPDAHEASNGDDVLGSDAPAEGANGVENGGEKQAEVKNGADGSARTGAGESPEGDGRVLDALLEELQETELSEEDRSVLQDALDVETASPNTLEARVRHVQNAVDDLEAYRDALDEFIGEHGDGPTIVDEFDQSIDALESSVGDLESSLADVEERLEECADSESVAALEDRAAELDRRLETFEETVDGLEDRADEFDQGIDALEETVEGLENRADEFDHRLEALADLEETVASHEDELATAREERATARAWRRQVSEATALPGAADEGDEHGAADEEDERSNGAVAEGAQDEPDVEAE